MNLSPASIVTNGQPKRAIIRHIFIVTYPNNKLEESICLSSRVKVWRYLTDIGPVYHVLHGSRPGLSKKGPPIKSYWSFTRQIIDGNHFTLICMGKDGRVFVEVNKYPLL